MFWGNSKPLSFNDLQEDVKKFKKESDEESYNSADPKQFYRHASNVIINNMEKEEEEEEEEEDDDDEEEEEEDPSFNMGTKFTSDEYDKMEKLNIENTLNYDRSTGVGLYFLKNEPNVVVKDYYFLKDNKPKLEHRHQLRINLASVPLIKETNVDSFVAEVSFLSRVTHPNIIEMLTFDKKNLTLQMPFTGIDLNTWYHNNKNKKTYDADLKKIIPKLIDGMEAIHKNRFSHNDIHMRNILVNGDDVKYIDFETCVKTTQSFTLKEYLCPMVQPKESITKYKNNEDLQLLDVFGLGNILFELITSYDNIDGDFYDDDNDFEEYNILLSMLCEKEKRKTIFEIKKNIY